MSHGVGRLRRALDHQYAAAVTVGSGALVALVWSALSSSQYRRVTEHPWVSGREVGLHGVIVNGAMTLFFAAVGLELSREVRTDLRGHLRSSLSPLMGAAGGMAGTAALSLAAGAVLGSSALRRGWGIPMATDIAFTLGVLALAGRAVPSELRLFLLTLAIADDVLSVIVLTFTGHQHLRVGGLAAIVVVGLGALLLARRTPTTPVFWVILCAMWLAFAWAGVEPALSGVLTGLVVPVTSVRTRHLERTVTRWSVGVALPLFAVVACGVTWSSLRLTGPTGTIILATVTIRVIGKVVGITAGVAVAAVLGARRPATLRVPVLVGATFLCSIGFTVPLLFAGDLYPTGSATYGAFTVGLFGASVLGAVLGVVVLRRSTRERD